MQIPADVARFVQGPVMVTLASRDAANRPAIARGSGVRVPPEPGRVEIALSAWLWPETVANLQGRGPLAATFVDAASYRAFQFKGRAGLRAAGDDDRACARAYIARAGGALAALGVAPSAIAFWLTDRDLVIATLEIDRIFEQTPGPRAGAVVT